MLKFRYRSVLRLSEIERILTDEEIIIPTPSRRTLKNWCEEGRFETLARHKPTDAWLVFADSFEKWLEQFKSG